MAGIVTIITLLAFMFDVFGVYRLFDSSASTGAKTAWIVVIMLFPIIGFLVWLAVGPKDRPAVT